MTRVLVVDDSVTQAKNLSWVLSDAGHDVEVMNQSTDVLSRLRTGAFDIVMSDVIMPGISGYELCRAIKADPELRHIHVILLTTLSQVSDILEGLAAGADNFVTKPYEPERLLARVDRILGRTDTDSAGRADERYVSFRNRTYHVDASRQQMLTFLISTFEDYEYSKLCERIALRNALESKRRTTNELAHKVRLLAQADKRLGEHQERSRELAEAKARADAELETKIRLLATISHELRTPLNGMVGASQLLASSRSAAERTEYAVLLLRSSRALSRLVDDILELARMETRAPSPETFRLHDVLGDLNALFKFEAKDKGLELRHHVDDGIPEAIIGDAQAVRRLLMNLVDNAIKFTPRGRVSIVCSLVEMHPTSVVVRFDVEDTGVGISADKQEKIFEPLFQEDISTTREYEGMGLGLSIATNLAKSMGGALEVVSTPGRGSVFSCEFWFQRVSTSGAETRTPGEDLPPTEQRGGHRILLVDDNPINRKVGSRLLERLGHECDVVNDGAKAIEAVRSARYSLVLMDCLMPVMDGYDAAATIRREEGIERVPIVALTAALLPEDRQRCLDAGMDAVLGKPVDINALQEILNKYL